MRALALSLLALLGCSNSSVVSATSELSVGPSALGFPATFVGNSSVLHLEILSAGRAPLTVQLTVTGPFEVDEAHVRVEGGALRLVPVRFRPQGPGAAPGTLRAGDVEVALSGEGLAAPTCAPTGPCDVAWFDPATGACQHTPSPEGSACADACVGAGQCVAGECLGAVRACDDDDACTLDACAPATGCVHSPKTCAAPENPCLAATCDREEGCRAVPVEDGTACGPSDCRVANVCLNGACVTATPPDGASCGASSPCQLRGVCQAQQCVGGAVTTMTPRWARTVPYQGTSFHGISDAAGALYWVECASDYTKPSGGPSWSCAAVSVTADGVERFRTPLPGAVPSVTRGFMGGPMLPSGASQLLDLGRFVVATPGSLAALDAATGAVLWERPFGVSALTGGEGMASVELASDGAGRLWALALPLIGGCIPFAVDHELLRLDLATGVLLSQVQLPNAAGLVVEHQVAFVGSDVAPGRVRAWDASGAQRFDVTHSAAMRLVAANGALLTRQNQLLDAATGAALGQLATFPASREEAVVEGGRVYRVGPTPTGGGEVLMRFDAATPGGAVLASLGRTATHPLLASSIAGPTRVPLVVAAGQHLSQSQLQLVGADATGAEAFRCALGPPSNPSHTMEWLEPSMAFTGSRLAVLVRRECLVCDAEGSATLEVYDAPTLAPAAGGWSTTRGGPGHTGRAL